VIGIALSSLADGSSPLFWWILTGLIFSLFGDLFLIRSDQPRSFRKGLAAFLLAQICYIIAFTLPVGFHYYDLLTGALLVIPFTYFYCRFRPGLNGIKIPVIIYMVAISLMVNRAVSLLFGNTFTMIRALLVSSGAFFFYISDVLLAWNKFVRKFKGNRISLALYYSAQILIALSLTIK
jgi:uncharacterized membrane protein YhhN